MQTDPAGLENSSEYKRKKARKVVFVHHEGGIGRLDQLVITQDSILGYLTATGNDSVAYNPGITKTSGIITATKDNRKILNEVHLILKKDNNLKNNDFVKLPFSEIGVVHLVEPDTGKSIAAFIGGFFLFQLLVAIIVLLTKSSCPFLYVHNGEGLVFEGEIFSGAVLHNLERHDYMPLPSIRPHQGYYHLQIANELEEKQSINLAELLVVNHPPETRVLFDEEGVLHTIKNETAPLSIVSATGKDERAALLHRDSLIYLFNEVETDRHFLDLTFDKPQDATAGKLLLKGKNTEWGDHVFAEFAQMFGNKFNYWKRRQEKMTREERLESVRNTEMPLTIYLKVKEQWQEIDYVYMVGPLGEREMVVPIDLSDLNDRRLELRLSTGFMMWQLDKVAMDFSADQPLEVLRLQPKKAQGISGKALQALKADDDHYLRQNKVGDYADLFYPQIDIPEGQIQSVFLHAIGYYEQLRRFKGKPDVAALEQFRNPGHFSRFSKQLFLQNMEQPEIFVTQ